MNLLIFNLRVDRDHTALGFTTDWINELARHFEHVTVITMYRGHLAVAGNVEVLSAGLERGWSKARRTLEFYRHLLAVLRRRRYDCCFSHMMPLFTLLAGPVLRWRGVPSALWYAHNHRPAILPLATMFAERALASTRTAFPLETAKLRVVGQGIDTHRFRPPTADDAGATLRLISVGRFSRIKNIDVMIRALAHLHRAQPALPVSLSLIGEALSEADRAYVSECRELARGLGVEPLVAWEGPVPFARIHEAYHTGDVFLSANDNGLDKAILEAMASGLAVVAMHPALAEPLGPYFAPDDASFTRALERIALLRPRERKDMGLALRDYVGREHGLGQLGARIADELKALAR